MLRLGAAASVLYVAILIMLFYMEDRWAYMIGMLAPVVAFAVEMTKFRAMSSNDLYCAHSCFTRSFCAFQSPPVSVIAHAIVASTEA